MISLDKKNCSFWYGTIIAINDESFIITPDYDKSLPFWGGASQHSLLSREYVDTAIPKYVGQYVIVTRYRDPSSCCLETKVYDANNCYIKMAEEEKNSNGLGRK